MRFLTCLCPGKNGISGLARRNFMKAEWSYGRKQTNKQTKSHVKEGTHVKETHVKGRWGREVLGLWY